MNPHISDELPRLLTGEADHDTVLAAAEHLRGCVDCQHELISAVVAHASLTSAQRFAPEIVSGDGAPVVTEPSPAPDRAPAPPVDLSAVFAQVRAEVDAEAPRPARRMRPRYLVAAAAAAVVVAAGGAIWVAESNDQGGTPSTRTVALTAFGVGRTHGTAKLGNGQITVDASSLPTLDNHRYEVWLTNDARTQMQPIGWIADNGTATLDVPDGLMSHYQDLEVSLQDTAAKTYNYSGTSVLRGSMA
jgi:hypothetical protein